MLPIECVGEALFLLPEKAVFWPREKTLLVADLHLGKAAAFRQAGIAVPESTTQHDLEQLEKILIRTASARLVILGDFFHAASGRQRAMMETVRNWCGANPRRKIILVPGNHDRASGPPPQSWGMESVDEGWAAPPFLFRHTPLEVPGQYVLAGHIHPAILLRERFGSSLRAPCFCFGPRRAILPAFGSFTGMHNIEPTEGERIFAVGAEEVIDVSKGVQPRKKMSHRPADNSRGAS